MNDTGATFNFPGNCASFKFKQKITGSTGDDGTKNVEIKVILKYLSTFSKTLEMPLINCEINLVLSWSVKPIVIYVYIYIYIYIYFASAFFQLLFSHISYILHFH